MKKISIFSEDKRFPYAKELFSDRGYRCALNDMSSLADADALLLSVAPTDTENSLSTLLPILCLITVNLGIFNLLPIPALDGGRLVFITAEMIFRRPIAKKYEPYVHAAGLILLLGLIGVVTINDIIRLIKG